MFLQRQADTLYRMNDSSAPETIAIADGVLIHVMCGICTQEYALQVSANMRYDSAAVPLYMQPQSVYIVSESQKRLRYLHCLECGSAFHSISDRIASMNDNRIPFEYVDTARLGPIETMCRADKCSQAWSIMV